MHSYKKFSLMIIAFLLGFYLFNVIIWKLFTEELITGRHSVVGDLARMGYVRGVKFFRVNADDLPRRHLEQEDYKGEKIDLLTIGDSFSNGGGGGRNRYYQDYIASINYFTVMNIEPYKDLDLVTLAAVYANNGYLDKVKPRYLIISSSEKFCVEKLARTIDFNKNIPMKDFSAMKRIAYRQNVADVTPEVKETQFGFINDGNLKFLLYSLYYHFSDHAFFSKTYKKTLRSPLFSVKESTTLLFYRDDVKNLKYASPGNMEKMNDNLNQLADKLAGKGIKLYFMPCVDKYNLYSEFIINNSYPQSTFFETLSSLPKRYTLIDTKAILLPEVRSGVKDIFHADDTHWSSKASKVIFEKVRFQ